MKRAVITGFLLSGIVLANAQNFWKLNPGKLGKVILTNSKTGEKLKEKGTVKFEKFEQPKETDICVFVDPDFRYQKLIGIGGAITDAAAETLYKLPVAKQNEILEAYYGKTGIGYNMVRSTMGSSDFSSDSYVYVKDNDTELKTFSVSHDEKYKLPMIKAAQKLIGKDFTFFFAPWTPPAWMKTNNNLLKGGRLIKDYYQPWANYYIKFIQEYEKRGIPVWGLSVQNEPMATQTWESCLYTADEEREFLTKNLGPTLWKNGYKDKKLMIWDHNRDLMYQRATTTLNNDEAKKYVSGIAYHWYETWTKSKPLFNNVAETAKAFPDKFLIFSEGCKEQFDFKKIYDVSLGELYGRNMINDFNNGTAAWTDWNVVVDEKGGPNHVGNYCFAPIIVDTRTNEVHYTYEYYYVGHLSKFVKKGAQRVGTASNRDFVLATTFMNSNGQMVVVLMNEGDNDADCNLWIEGEAAKINAPAHSIQTIII